MRKILAVLALVPALLSAQQARVMPRASSSQFGDSSLVISSDTNTSKSTFITRAVSLDQIRKALSKFKFDSLLLANGHWRPAAVSDMYADDSLGGMTGPLLAIGTKAGNAGGSGIYLARRSGTVTAASYYAEVWDSVTGAESQLILRRAHATGTNPATKLAVASGDLLGSVYFQGWDSTTYSASAAMRATAMENFGTTAHGTNLDFFTVPSGSTTLTSRWRVGNGGSFFPSSTDSTLDIGGIPSNRIRHLFWAGQLRGPNATAGQPAYTFQNSQTTGFYRFGADTIGVAIAGSNAFSITGVSRLVGGANSMVLTSGTGASRTLVLQTTTSGGVATDAISISNLQKTTFANSILAADGSAATPSVSLANSSTTGLYRFGADTLGFTASGRVAGYMLDSALQMDAGRASRPSYGFTTTNDTVGMYRAGLDTLGFATKGVATLKLFGGINPFLMAGNTGSMTIQSGTNANSQITFKTTNPSSAFLNTFVIGNADSSSVGLRIRAAAAGSAVHPSLEVGNEGSAGTGFYSPQLDTLWLGTSGAAHSRWFRGTDKSYYQTANDTLNFGAASSALVNLINAGSNKVKFNFTGDTVFVGTDVNGATGSVLMFRSTTTGAAIVNALSIDATQNLSARTGSFLGIDGAASTPSYAFNNSTNSGMYLINNSSTDTVLFAANGTVRGRLSSNGTMWQGTQTNDNAVAGYVGEYVSSTIASASAVSLSTTVAANMTSISLTAGDWDVSCVLYHKLAATTTTTLLQGGISTTSATLPTTTGGTSDYAVWRQTSSAPGGDITQSIGPVRESLSGTTTVYCVGNDTFGTSTDAAYGTLRARRIR